MDNKDRAQRAAEVLTKEPTTTTKKERSGLFIWIIAALLGTCAIGLAAIFSQVGPPPQVAVAATDATAAPDDSDDDYGADKSTPTPLPPGVVSYTTPTPAPGIIPCRSSQCAANGVQSGTVTPAQANDTYQAAANRAMTTTGDTGSYATPAPVPASAIRTAQLIQVDSPAGDAVSAATTAVTDPNDLGAVRQRLLAESAAASSGQVPPISTNPPQQANAPSPTLGTTIVPAEAYEIPMGTCVKVALPGNLDSSLSGPIQAVVYEAGRDPRNGATLIPPSSVAIGHFIGLTQNSDHLGLAWDWMRYPDPSKRPLNASIETTENTGESGLAGRVNTHLVQQFRNTFFQSVVGASGQIIASALTHGTNISLGTGSATTTPPGQQILPTLYTNKRTEFCLYLAADYDATVPYTDHAP